MAPLRCVTVAVLVVREGALAVPARGGSGKRRSTGACRRGVQQVVRANPDSTPLRRSSCGSGPCRFGGRTAAEDQSAAFLILPWTAAGKRAFRSELPAAFFEHSEQRNALHPKARAHVRDSWLLRTPLARSAVTTVRPCTRARAITNGSATDLLRRIFTNCGNFARISVALA
jgi:hypothetical protein